MKGENRPADISQQQAGELHEPGSNFGLVDLLNRNAELDLDPLADRRDSVPRQIRNSATTSLELALVWAFVGIPLLWGIYGTLVNAMKLFQ
jgi:hypothetical protein